MRHALLLAAIIFALTRAGSFDAAGQSYNLKVVRAFLATENDPKPTTTFSDTVPRIDMIWKGDGLQPGDRIRVVWIAEDVGAASPKETKINEGSSIVYKPDDKGEVSLSRPKSRGWPIGKYRADVYVGKQLVKALRFTIQSGVKVDVN